MDVNNSTLIRIGSDDIPTDKYLLLIRKSPNVMNVNLEEVINKLNIKAVNDHIQSEANGFISVGATLELGDTPDIKFAFIRKSPRSLVESLKETITKKLGVKDLISMRMSESDGNITLSIFYR